MKSIFPIHNLGKYRIGCQFVYDPCKWGLGVSVGYDPSATYLAIDRLYIVCFQIGPFRISPQVSRQRIYTLEPLDPEWRDRIKAQLEAFMLKEDSK